MASAPEVAPRDGLKRLLVVDDEAAVRELLADGLEAFGYEIKLAATALEALQVLERDAIDLVLSDIDMPEVSGIDLLERIRREYPDIDVVMVTGCVDTEVAVGSIRKGAYDYVTKPFNLEEVRYVVDRTLKHRRDLLEKREYQTQLKAEKELLAVKVDERTRELRVKNEEVGRLFRELQRSYESTLQSLVTALDFRDNETQGHSVRVVEYAVEVAKRLNVVEPELTWIRRGALLHDVGKIGIPDAILRKPGKLTTDEWVEMKKHPEMGYRMLRHIEHLEPALDIVLCHQERWDGTGYPRGLKGVAIPLGARIFAVVDTFDAMTSDRPYREALTIERAMEEVREFSGRQFDPRVAEAFLSIPIETWREIRERVHRDFSRMD